MNSNFLLAINKPTGLTSSDVVVKVRKILSNYYGEKIKVGHMGTLDPGASGVLIVGVNKAARLFEFLLQKNKTYIGRLELGTKTDTLDSYGKILDQNNNFPKLDEILAAIKTQVGEISQIPPKFSALKINGQKGYDLARANKDFEFQARKVTIDYIKPLRYQLEGELVKNIDLEVCCSAGTYIRTLFEDIAENANSLGFMAYLIRKSILNIDLNDTILLEDLEKDPNIGRINPLKVISKLMKVITIDPKSYKKITNGIPIELDYTDEFLAITNNDNLELILKYDGEKYRAHTNLR